MADDAKDPDNITITAVGKGEAGYTVGHATIDTPRITLPDRITVTNTRNVKVEYKFDPPVITEDPIEAFIWQWVYGGMDEMPFLPIEQLPEAWKDGRRVLVRYVDDVFYIDYVSRVMQGVNPTTWQQTNPTHFCPIPLTKEP